MAIQRDDLPGYPPPPISEDPFEFETTQQPFTLSLAEADTILEWALDSRGLNENISHTYPYWLAWHGDLVDRIRWWRHRHQGYECEHVWQIDEDPELVHCYLCSLQVRIDQIGTGWTDEEWKARTYLADQLDRD